MKLNELTEVDLLKKELISTLKGFIVFCKQHNLRYYAAYGTALGTVRHKGLIPWDDDIDVFMPREDYNKFLLLRNTLKTSEYEIVDIENKGYYLFFAKWCKRNSTIIEKQGQPALGIYIDIFPLDYFDEEYCKPLIRYNELYRYMWLIYGHGSRKYSISEFCSIINLIFSRRFNRALTILLDNTIFKVLKLPSLFIIKKMMMYLEKAPKTSNYWRYSFISSENYYIPVEWFGEGKKMPFEDIEILMPVNYDAFLTRNYGDYMTPPPIDKRESHHARYFIDFNQRYSLEEVRKLKNR